MSRTKARMLPPIRADLAYEIRSGESQLHKKWLKKENLDSRKNDGMKFLEGKINDYEAL